MRWGVLVGIAGVAVVGGLVAVLAVGLTGPTSEPPSPPVIDAPSDGAPVQTASSTRRADPTGGRVALPEGIGERQIAELPDPSNVPEGEVVHVDLGPAFEGEVETFQDLEGRYEAALAAHVDLKGLEGQDVTEAHKALDRRVFQATAVVSAAADAHLRFAEGAPRAQADQARGRAAELYEHLAGVLEDAPVPAGTSSGSAELRSEVLSRMAERHRRQASALRAAKQ